MAKQKSGAAEAEQAQTVLIGVDKSDEAILQLDQADEYSLKWDPNPDNFRMLSESVWTKLRPQNLAAYIKAESANVDILRVQNARSVEIVENPFNPVQGDADKREYIRPRKGWHQAWKNPGSQYDEALMGGYVAVRKKVKPEEKAGEETGEIMKRVDAENRVEAIAVECPEHLFRQYLEWMSQNSQRRFGGIKAGFAAGIEDINRGMSRGDTKIVPMDEDGKPLV